MNWEWYSAMLRVAALVGDRPASVWGTVVLFRAPGWEEARARALALGREREQTYVNGEGVRVQHVFARVETLDLIGDELDGREIYSERLEDPERAARELADGPEAWEPTQSGV